MIDIHERINENKIRSDQRKATERLSMIVDNIENDLENLNMEPDYYKKQISIAKIVMANPFSDSDTKKRARKAIKKINEICGIKWWQIWKNP